jgi:hypothetical protein
VAGPRFIVWEKTNRWAIAFRWTLAGSGVRIRETRNWLDCRRELDLAPSSLLALELRIGNFEEALESLSVIRREYPHAGTLVLTSPEWMDLQWIYREAGALHAVCSNCSLGPAVRLVQRYLRMAPQETRDCYDELFDRLPWEP